MLKLSIDILINNSLVVMDYEDGLLCFDIWTIRISVRWQCFLLSAINEQIIE